MIYRSVCVEAVVYEYGANISDFWQACPITVSLFTGYFEVFYAVRGASSFSLACLVAGWARRGPRIESYKRSQPNLSRVRILSLQRALSMILRLDFSRLNSFKRPLPFWRVT